MKQVQATGEPVVVTQRGAPVVKVVPAEADILGIIHEEVRRNNILQRDLKLRDLRGDRL